MTYVMKIIDAFGGVRPMARALGRPVSTVQSWKERGSIPDDNKWEVLSRAREQDLDLGPGDFFPVPQHRGAACCPPPERLSNALVLKSAVKYHC